MHIPHVERLLFDEQLSSSSAELLELQKAYLSYDLETDPYVKSLDKEAQSLKIHKVGTKRSTDTLDQLKALVRNATTLEEQLGPWASREFLQTCTQKSHDKLQRLQDMVWLTPVQNEELLLLHHILSSALDTSTGAFSFESDVGNISVKAATLLQWLSNIATDDLRGIIFVRERVTAVYLAKLIAIHSLTKNEYEVASFVGSSTHPSRSELVDVLDVKLQNIGINDFRAGKRNLMVSTSVLEEGIDVPAANLVVRFDPPPNFTAYIQSRGRARRPNSTFLLMYRRDELQGTEARELAELEDRMKAKYMDKTRMLAESEELDRAASGHQEYLSSQVTG